MTLPNVTLVLTTPEGVVAHLQDATSEADWNRRCDDVKAANAGYPSFWFEKVIMSGLAGRVAAKWPGDADIHIVSF